MLKGKIASPVKMHDLIFDALGILEKESVVILAILRIQSRFMDDLCTKSFYLQIKFVHLDA